MDPTLGLNISNAYFLGQTVIAGTVSYSSTEALFTDLYGATLLPTQNQDGTTSYLDSTGNTLAILDESGTLYCNVGNQIHTFSNVGIEPACKPEETIPVAPVCVCEQKQDVFTPESDQCIPPEIDKPDTTAAGAKNLFGALEEFYDESLAPIVEGIKSAAQQQPKSADAPAAPVSTMPSQPKKEDAIKNADILNSTPDVIKDDVVNQINNAPVIDEAVEEEFVSVEGDVEAEDIESDSASLEVASEGGKAPQSEDGVALGFASPENVNVEALPDLLVVGSPFESGSIPMSFSASILETVQTLSDSKSLSASGSQNPIYNAVDEVAGFVAGAAMIFEQVNLTGVVISEPDVVVETILDSTPVPEMPRPELAKFDKASPFVVFTSASEHHAKSVGRDVRTSGTGFASGAAPKIYEDDPQTLAEMVMQYFAGYQMGRSLSPSGTSTVLFTTKELEQRVAVLEHRGDPHRDQNGKGGQGRDGREQGNEQDEAEVFSIV